MRHWLRLHGVNFLRMSHIFLSFIRQQSRYPKRPCLLSHSSRPYVTVEETTPRAPAWSKYSRIAVLERRLGRPSLDRGIWGRGTTSYDHLFVFLALSEYVIIRAVFLHDQKAWSVSH